MPTAALRPCTYPGCPTLVSHGRCQKHMQQMPNQHREWDHLYGKVRWKIRRRIQLTQEPWCAECLKQGLYVPAKVADHVIPHRGDPVKFFMGELQSLCDSCHSRKTAQEVLNG